MRNVCYLPFRPAASPSTADVQPHPRCHNHLYYAWSRMLQCKNKHRNEMAGSPPPVCPVNLFRHQNFFGKLLCMRRWTWTQLFEWCILKSTQYKFHAFFFFFLLFSHQTTDCLLTLTQPTVLMFVSVFRACRRTLLQAHYSLSDCEAPNSGPG